MVVAVGLALAGGFLPGVMFMAVLAMNRDEKGADGCRFPDCRDGQEDLAELRSQATEEEQKAV